MYLATTLDTQTDKQTGNERHQKRPPSAADPDDKLYRNRTADSSGYKTQAGNVILTVNLKNPDVDFFLPLSFFFYARQKRPSALVEGYCVTHTFFHVLLGGRSCGHEGNTHRLDGRLDALTMFRV